MEYNKKTRDQELEKLKQGSFFDKETLEEIRKDLDDLIDDDLKKTESIIKENKKKIINQIPLEERVKYLKLQFR